jgi:hypothetical protein
MNGQADIPANPVGSPGVQLGRVGMICSLTALGAIAAILLLRPG